MRWMERIWSISPKLDKIISQFRKRQPVLFVEIQKHSATKLWIFHIWYQLLLFDKYFEWVFSFLIYFCPFLYLAYFPSYAKHLMAFKENPQTSPPPHPPKMLQPWFRSKFCCNKIINMMLDQEQLITSKSCSNENEYLYKIHITK